MGEKMKYEKPKLIDLNEHSMTSEGAFCTPTGSGASFQCMDGFNSASTCGTGSSAISSCTNGSSAKGIWCSTGTNPTGTCTIGSGK